MSWIVWLVLAAIALHLVFFRKQKRHEIVIRVESSVLSSAVDINAVNAEVDAKDNWESFDFYRAKMIPANGRYRITYEDQLGLKTDRDIVVKRVHEHDGRYAIDAHCLLRNEHRSFLGEGIKKSVNLDSGEIVADLACDAICQYAESGEGLALSAIDKEWMGVAVLIFVCRADGQMRKSERIIVANYLKKYCSNVLFEDDKLDSAIRALGNTDQKEFKRIIRDLKSAGEHGRLIDLLDCAKQIVATQKTIDPIEKAALEILEEAVA